MKKLSVILFLTIVLITACQDKTKSDPEAQFVIDTAKLLAEKKIMEMKMREHLDAVTNRDLKTLESTLTPNDNMQLILPGTEIMQTNAEFMEYHEGWFADTTTVWTFDTKILNSKAGPKNGMAVVEVLYKEPERDGKPYFNRMVVSYDLEKIDNKWYVMKDHASSIEKSTDQK